MTTRCCDDSLNSRIDLQSVWNYQLGYLLEKAYRLDPDTYTRVLRAWQRVVGSSADTDTDVGAAPGDAPESTSDAPDVTG
jgi:hypothetical protein